MVNAIELMQVSKHFTRDGAVTQALSDLDLTIEPGSFVSLIGPSGCGKSTMLRLIAGLAFPDGGRVAARGEAVTGPGADRGFMFQEHNLFPWLTISENIGFGLRARHDKGDIEARVAEMLDLVGLAEFADAYPHQLSGGMCQRASLARALAGRPSTLLLDEPLGALDAFTRMNIQSEIERIWQEEHMTMIMVTHDVDEAVYLSNTVIVMTARPGKIVARIPIKLSRPRPRSSPDFFHYSARILDLLHYGGKQPEPEYFL